MRTPRGTLTEEGHVNVDDQSEANRLYNKGFAGTPQRGGALRLSLIEAARLVEEERLDVKASDGSERSLSFRDLLEQAVASQPGAEIPLLAYRDLRGRGYVSRHANKRSLDFLVWERGESPPSAGPAWLAGAINERAPVEVSKLQKWLVEAREEQATLVLFVVDEEGDLTHYQVSEADPQGAAPAFPQSGRIEGVLLRDRVMVWDEPQAQLLRDVRFMGRSVPGGLQLSLVEAAALMENGVLACPGFWDQAETIEPDLMLRTRAYQELAKRGLWIKTGYKFGAHFRVYDAHPENSHAPWLVDAVGPDWNATWPQISRAVRLAHSVRKRFLLSVVEGERVQHIMIERLRP